MDWAQVRAEVSRLAVHVARDVAEEGRPAVRMVVKVRYAPFVTVTHGHALELPSADPDEIGRGALAALERFAADRPVRLLGVRAELAPDQGRDGRSRTSSRPALETGALPPAHP